MELYLVIAVIVLLVLILLWKFLMRKHAVVETYDYLEVLSYHIWKRGRQIKKEIENIKNGWLNDVEVYQALSNLEDEGLVERRHVDEEVDEVKITEFRLTSSGIRRKHEYEESEAMRTSLVARPA